MRNILSIGLAAGLLAAALPAQAETGNAVGNRSEAVTGEAPRINANGAPRERRICVREASSATRVRRTICHTAQEWRDLQGYESDANH